MKKAILRTLAYADIFDYPLKAVEIHHFLLSKRGVSLAKVSLELKQLLREKKIGGDGFYFFLKGRKKLIGIRKGRLKFGRKKFVIAQRAANWLRLVPGLKMVAVSGALAMENAQADDDIDFLMVTAGKRLWLTRLLVVALMELVAKRRRPEDKRVKDKICLNLFLDEDSLSFPKNEQNLFSAHEICQIKLLWSKKGIYQKFISQNQWVKEYLPNWKI